MKILQTNKNFCTFLDQKCAHSLPLSFRSSIQYAGPKTDEWDSVKRQVQRALEEFGCFEAKFDKIPTEIRKTIFGAMEELFDLPLEIKTRNVCELPYHGYLGQRPHAPLYESIGFDDPHVAENIEAQTRTFWAQGNTNFRKSIQSYTKQLKELDQTVRRMIMESFQVEKYMDEHMDSSGYLVKVTKYKGPQTIEKQVGLKAHTDINMLTILYQNEVNGFGVQSSTGEWVEWEPSKHSFIVVIGECLHATCHRVMLSGDKPRYSIGLFSFPKLGYMIKAPEELVDEEHPLLYKPFDYAQYLGFGFSNIGRYPQYDIRPYCGV
ncbi:gibberellin 3-beta-dioxygenase 1-like [Hibiscus syriacus]|uniref:Gibberellin 3-beta-dioxygenase 1-like n=1 Tax=Hibiscus syriacus TaxID=106335 RepID=A0A6A2YNE4_HIBSY|nr:probable 2-oxoglutarate-dependent dioxygenase AOP1 [Hibiscus syriacus]KAE8680792.1 gibberellin 3-beta-dioxygenase 1-like [Hibiscus syriacus]